MDQVIRSKAKFMNKHDLHSFKIVWLWKRATALVTIIIFPFSAAVFAKRNLKSRDCDGHKGLQYLATGFHTVRWPVYQCMGFAFKSAHCYLC